MPRIAFDALPDHARVFVFAAERPLAHDEQAALLSDVDAFLDGWAAHGAPLRCGRDLRYDRFLMVAVDERAAGVSGCSIDALTQKLRQHERLLGAALMDNGPVLYRGEDGIVRMSRAAFGDLADAGAVSPDTIVFNNTVPDLGSIRSGRWETRAGDSWHGRVFFKE